MSGKVVATNPSMISTISGTNRQSKKTTRVTNASAMNTMLVRGAIKTGNKMIPVVNKNIIKNSRNLVSNSMAVTNSRQ